MTVTSCSCHLLFCLFLKRQTKVPLSRFCRQTRLHHITTHMSPFSGWWSSLLFSSQGGKEFILTWILRMAVTLILAVIWHGMVSIRRWRQQQQQKQQKQQRPSQPASLRSRCCAEGEEDDDETPTRCNRNNLMATGSSDYPNIISSHRQGFLDRLEQQQKTQKMRINDVPMNQQQTTVSQQQAPPTMHDYTHHDKEETNVLLSNHKHQVAATLPKTKPSSTQQDKEPTTPSRLLPPPSIPTTTTTTSTLAPLPPFQNVSNHHPGLKFSGFYDWYNVETSLYRMYQIGTTTTSDSDVIPPPLYYFNPKSRRGQVPITLQVTNEMSICRIEAFWIDYQGNEKSRGKFYPGTTWTQTTWLEHPWTFRTCCGHDGHGHDDNIENDHHKHPSGQLLVHFIPYRVIPTIPNVPTISIDDPDMGMHRFTIRDNRCTSTPLFRHGNNNTTTIRHHNNNNRDLTNYHQKEDDEQEENSQHHRFWTCQIEDPVLPYPPAQFFQNNSMTAITWVLQHMERTRYNDNDVSWTILCKYLMNIIHHPDRPHYRQWVIGRTKTKFYQHVWNTTARGVLLALGAIDRGGSYCELGTDHQPFPPSRVREISQVLSMLHQWKQQTNNNMAHHQPEGAEDGFGSAGYGRAGQLNL